MKCPLLLAIGDAAVQELEELRKRLESYGWADRVEFAQISVDGDQHLDVFPNHVRFTRAPEYLQWAESYAHVKRRIRSEVGKRALRGFDLASLEPDLDQLIAELIRIRDGEVFLATKIDGAALPSNLKDWLKTHLDCGTPDEQAARRAQYGVRPSEYLWNTRYMVNRRTGKPGNEELQGARELLESWLPNRHVIVVGAFWDWNVTDIIFRYLRHQSPRLQFITLKLDLPEVSLTGDRWSELQTHALKKAEEEYLRDRIRVEVKWHESERRAADYLEGWIWRGGPHLPHHLIFRRVVVETAWPSGRRARMVAELPPRDLPASLADPATLEKDKLDFLAGTRLNGWETHLAIHSQLTQRLRKAGLQIIDPATGVAFDLAANHLDCPYLNLVALIATPAPAGGTSPSP